MNLNKLLIATFLMISFSSCSQNLNEHKSKDYSLSYSDEMWKFEKANNQEIFFVKVEKETTFNSNVNLLVQDLSQNPMNLEDYHKLTLQQMQRALGQNTVKSNKDVTISGLKAKELIYTIPMDASKGSFLELKLKQVYLIKDNKAYLITYTAKNNDFEKYLKSANKFFETFKLN